MRKGVIVCRCTYRKGKEPKFKSYASAEFIRRKAREDIFKRLKDEDDRRHSDRICEGAS